jgi:hypothetical protein
VCFLNLFLFLHQLLAFEQGARAEPEKLESRGILNYDL